MSRPLLFSDCADGWLTLAAAFLLMQSAGALDDLAEMFIEKGELILRPMEKQADPEGLSALEQFLAERLKPISLLDVLTQTEQWLNWSPTA